MIIVNLDVMLANRKMKFNLLYAKSNFSYRTLEVKYLHYNYTNFNWVDCFHL